jgi:hypothetical protein
MPQVRFGLNLARTQNTRVFINNLEKLRLGHPFRNRRFKNHEHEPGLTSSRNIVRNHPIPGRSTRQVDHSRCCLLVVPLCQRRIFHTIVLDSSSKEIHIKMMRLEENITWSPHLATYVRSFEICLWDGWTHIRRHPRFYQLLSKITPSLTHVQTLKIYGTKIHSKDVESYLDWSLITGSLDPDKQDSGIAIEKLLVGEHLRHLETRGILRFPFTLFLERCRVVDSLTDDLPHAIAICAVEMFRDASPSNAVSSIRSYTLSRVECTDRRMSPAWEENPPKPLTLNFTNMTSLAVTWHRNRDITETEKLIHLGRSIEILSISGECHICFHEYALTAVKVQPQLNFFGLAKFFSSTARQTVKSVHLQNIPSARPNLRDKYDHACSALSTQLEQIDLRGYQSLGQLSITLHMGSKSVRLDRGELERLDSAISCNFTSPKRVTVKLFIYQQHNGYYPTHWEPGVDARNRDRMATLCTKYGSDFVLTHEKEIQERD